MNSTTGRRFEAFVSTPEMRLLLACCKRATGRFDDGQLAEALAVPFNERAFVDLCNEHRLFLLVYRWLVRPHGARFSPETVARFEDGFKRCAFLQMRMAASLKEIHREFAREKVRHLFLKGSVLNHQLFGAELLRYSGDVDVLVDPADHLKADACLKRIGYKPNLYRWRSATGIPLRWTFHKDTAYLKKDAPYIELHWRTDATETLMVPRRFDWSAGVTISEFQGESIPVFEDYRNCLYLCLHAAKHDWERIQWLVDIPLFIRVRGLDPERLFEEAERHGLRQVVEEALFLSATLLDEDWGTGLLTLKRVLDGNSPGRVMRRFLWSHGPSLGKAKFVLLLLERSRIYPGILNKFKFLGILLLHWALLRIGNKPVKS
jgi:hypothetical protein